MSIQIKAITVTPELLSTMLGLLAEHLIEKEKMSPDTVIKLGKIGNDLIGEAMSQHDLNFHEGIILLSIMLESTLSLYAEQQICPLMGPMGTA